MELFERIYHLKFLAGSLQAVADVLGIAPQKISAYANLKSQKNFYPLLPNILKAYPQVSRDWLYFGEGEMLIADGCQPEDGGANLASKVQELKLANEQLSQMNRQLLEQNHKLIDQNHALLGELLKQSLKGEQE